jgi:uncharacterized protein YggE
LEEVKGKRNKMNPKALLIPLVAGLALLAVACSGGDTYVTSDSSGQSGVVATGTGRAYGEPDVMVLTIGVQAQRANIAEAREAAASAQTKVIEALKSNGVKDEDIQTVQFNVSPVYDYSQERSQPEVIGYMVGDVVSAKVRELDTAGEVIDAATEAGGNDAVVQGVWFGIDDPTELQAEARKEAVEKARAQAEQLASDAGASLGKLLTISESGGYLPLDRGFPEAAGGAAFDSAATTPIESGQLEISVSVSVVYAIE